MKLKKLITTALMLALSVTMAFSLTACFGGDNAKYTVTFDANGGTMPNNATTMEVTMGENYTLPTPTKTGFDFDGWKNQEQSVAVSGTWSIESNVTLKASWNAKTTAVTLNVNGGTGATQTTLTATYGEVLSLPTLTKVGYTFAGWKLNDGAYDASATWALEDATATLKAQWTVKTTTVTLNVDGGVGADELELTATYGQVLSLPTLTKTGYNFAGWTLGGNAFDTTATWALEDATATLVATWTAKTTTVTLNLDGGTGADELELTATYGVVLNLPTVTKSGFKFAGWKLNGNAYDASAAWALEDATATLVATWTEKGTTVTLSLDGGSYDGDTTIVAIYGQVLTLKDPTKVGFNFAGWTLNGSAFNTANAWALEDETATLVATWTAKTTTVTLDVDGGVGAEDLELTATYGQVLSLPTLTKTGYNFAGWTLGGNAFDTTATWALEDATATLVATWTAKTTTVTLNLDGGTGADELELTATYGVVLNLPTVTKSGFKFAGWKLNGNAYDASAAWALEDATATLVATWTEKGTTVTLSLDGGSYDGDTTIVAIYGQVLTLKDPTKVGFNFAGWTLNGSAFNTANAWALEDETATLVATWTAKTTTVTLDVDGGVGAEDLELTATYGQVLSLPTLTKTGYNFAGWTLGGNAFDTTATWALEDATATLVATWTAKTTTVTLNLDGGSYDGETTVTATYGQVLTLKNPTKAGYTFASWMLGGSAYDTANAWALEDATATLVATYNAKSIPVTFNTNGGAQVDATNFTFGQAPYADAGLVPTTNKDYCTFAGWLYKGELVDLTAIWDKDAESIELVASWTGNKLNVTIKYADSEKVDNVEVTYGDAYELKSTVAGYKFDKLVIEDTEQEVEASGDAWNYGAITLVATVTPKTYNVYVKDFNGNIVNQGNPLVVTFGGEFSLVQFIPSQDSQIIDGKQMYFDGFRVEGTEIKVTEFENLVVGQDLGDEDIILVTTYESEDIWI